MENLSKLKFLITCFLLCTFQVRSAEKITGFGEVGKDLIKVVSKDSSGKEVTSFVSTSEVKLTGFSEGGKDVVKVVSKGPSGEEVISFVPTSQLKITGFGSSDKKLTEFGRSDKKITEFGTSDKKITSFGTCEEVNEQYSICDGNKYLREKNVSDSLKRDVKAIEESTGSGKSITERESISK